MSTDAAPLAHRRFRQGHVEPALITVLRQLDPLIVVACLIGCHVVYGERLTMATMALALLAFIISTQLFGRFDPRESAIGPQPVSGFVKTYSRTVLQWGAVVAVLLLAAFALKVSAVFSRKVLLTWFVVTPTALCAAQALRTRVQQRITHNAAAPRYIIIGVNDVGLELARHLPEAGFSGYFDFQSPERITPTVEPEKFVGHPDAVADYVRAHGVSIVYVALPLAKVPRIRELVHALRDTTASVYFIPDLFAFDLIQGRLVEINGMPALSLCDTPFYGMDALLKRAMDITLAGLGLVVLLPVFAVIAAAVKLTSRGPVLFRQRRYGLNGEEIRIYKFRSMTVCEDGAQVTQATEEDRRVTPLGRFLRRYSLDELPQLLNVLQGSMSLVGPRPHAVAHNERYRALIDGYMLRHKVRPGITGLAQVNGLRGETEALEKMSARVRYDLEYLRNWSPWLDIKILFRSLGVIWDDRKHGY
jgi:putative colanic acid biosynthesis UDP-glucose lipid carrier transferase